MTLSRFNAGTRAHKLSGWHPQHKKKRRGEGVRGKEEGGGLNFSVSLRFWGFTCIKYSATDQVIIQNNFSYIHFFLIYFWGVTSRLQYYLLSFVARFFGYWVNISLLSVTMVWNEKKVLYLREVHSYFIHDSKHTVNSFSLGFYLLQRENYNTRELRYQKYYGSSTIQ